MSPASKADAINESGRIWLSDTKLMASTHPRPLQRDTWAPGDVLAICVAETCEGKRENGGATSKRMWNPGHRVETPVIQPSTESESNGSMLDGTWPLGIEAAFGKHYDDDRVPLVQPSGAHRLQADKIAASVKDELQHGITKVVPT